jgi:hypothetical protein
MHRAQLSSSRFVLGIMMSLSGCLGDEPREGSVKQTDSTALVGSFPGDDPRFEAVGGIAVAADDSASDRPLVLVCTGTVIAPKVVVTAKHCLDAAHDFGEGHRLVFTLGPNGNAPRRVFEVLAKEGAPHDHGGYTGYGRDIGVLHLTEPVSGVVPPQIAGLTDAMIGKSFLAIGYGSMDDSQAYGYRRLGSIALKARRGLVYEALLGSFEAFYEFETGHPLAAECNITGNQIPDLRDVVRGRAATCETAELVRAIFDSYRLEQLDEVAAGGGPNDVQPCSGDSGGPLLLSDASGTLTAYGVASGGLTSRDLRCANGSIYASFGPTALTFLREAIRWRDPCADLPSDGVCKGNVALRCSTQKEGARRKLSFDCGSVGSTCQVQARSTVGCGVSADGSDERVEAPMAAPDPALIPWSAGVDRRGYLQPGARLSAVATPP